MIRELSWLIHRYDSVTSTMDVAKCLALFGTRDRTVVVSAEQTAGRGRGGRTWHAPAGTAVFCTIVLRPPVAPDRLSTLPLVAGVAVADAIEGVSGCAVRLKWPNDVWLGADTDNPKVAGVLVASNVRGNVVDYALVGIGVNVLGAAKELPPGATSIEAAAGVTAFPDRVFDELLVRFDGVYADYVAADGRSSLAGWRSRAALRGETVTVEDAGRSFTGTFVDVDEDGALLIKEPENTVRRVVVGDLIRGPRPVLQSE